MSLEHNSVITLKSVQDTSGQKDYINNSAPAYFEEKDGEYTVKYKIYYDEDHLLESEETIRILPDGKVAMNRTGFLCSSFVFERGKNNICDYDTPAGHISIDVYTSDVQIKRVGNRLTAEIEYTFSFFADVPVNTKFLISVELYNERNNK